VGSGERVAVAAREEASSHKRRIDLHHAELNRMLPALAGYMGQMGVGSTERYLSLTPERLQTQLDELSPMRRKKR
jgi:hypothetical protein